jgi:hypothetical protein
MLVLAVALGHAGLVGGLIGSGQPKVIGSAGKADQLARPRAMALQTRLLAGAPSARTPSVDRFAAVAEGRGPAGRLAAAQTQDPAPANAASNGAAAAPAPEPSSAPGQPPAEPADPPPPIYRTRVPPAFVAGYRTRRGETAGHAELHWEPAVDGYVLRLVGGFAGASAIEMKSQGGFDEAGLAPGRLVNKRRGREVQAVNFRRPDQGNQARITFSGTPVEATLTPGAQDRLSWLVQLPAIFAADPALAMAGRIVELAVAEPRGRSGVWAFRVLEAEEEHAEGPAASGPAWIHLRREASRPYDTQVDVWLDRSRHHLPVRLRLQNAPAPEVTDLELEAVLSGGS